MLFWRISRFLIFILAINTVLAFNASASAPFTIQADGNPPAGCPEGQSVSVNFKEWMPFGVVKLEINNTGSEYVQLTAFEIYWIQRAPGVLTLNRVTVDGTGPSDPSGKIIWQSGSPAEDANPPTTASADPSGSEGNWLDDYLFWPNTVTSLYLDFDGTTTTLPIAFGATPSDLNGTSFDTTCIDRNRPPRADARGVDANGNTMMENMPIVLMTDAAGSLLIVPLDGTQSRDPDGMIVRYLWTINGVTFADGDLITAGTPQFQLGPGIHTVILTVYDNGGATDEDEIIVTIQTPNPDALIVTTTADSNDGTCNSQCSLREAITLSNSTSGTQTIQFNIPNAPPYTIQPTSALPDITAPIIIDGWSEPDFTGTPIIVIGSGQWSSLNITGGNSTVRGLVIATISIQTNGGNTIQGNYIGTDVSGYGAAGNAQNGITITSGNNLIGGTTSQARNLISGHSLAGIQVAGMGNVIQGNFIGTDAAGTGALGNQIGIIILDNISSNVIIGGTTLGAANVISGNTSLGINSISEDGINDVIQGNYIGTDLTGMLDLGNGVAGIFIDGTDVMIGGTTAGAGNTIAFNGDMGIGIGTQSTQIAILGNSIFSNKATIPVGSGIGIDLDESGSGGYGVTPNDAGDTDEGGNNLQNFPILTTAYKSGSNLNINGMLNSTANSTYRVEFFTNDACDPSGNGEGQRFVGFANVTTNATGNAAIITNLAANITVGEFVTATATDSNNNTSEFSACQAVTLAPPVTALTVTTTDDTNDGICDSQCSLREAITLSNGASGQQIILFNIPGVAPYTIQPTSALPAITDPVVIDGWSEPDFVATPIIELDGSLLTNGNGLTITAGNSTVRGLVLPGISIQVNGGNTIQGNYIGTNVAGNATVDNGYGIWIDNTSDNIIGGVNAQARNVISGKGSVNIYLDGSGATNNVIAGNYIGTNAAGTSGLYPDSNGIWISGPENTIGPGNLISGNSFGIQILNAASIGNVIEGNYIGTNAAGTSSISNEYGITIIADFNNPANSPSETSILNNLISGNNSWGISIDGTGNIVQGNYIGTDFTGIVDLGNGIAGIFAGGSNSTIGGTIAGTGNIIAFNGDWGIWIGRSYSTIAILGNSIFANKATHSSTFGLGIDLESGEIPSPNSGVTPNDAGDSDEGANNLQNFPVLTSTSATSSAITIKSMLNSAANTTYRIEFFANDACDPSGYGEGQIFVGATNVTTNGSGNASFNLEFSFAATVGQYLTATATDPDGNTSEFSRCREILSGSSTNDVPERNAFPTTDVSLTWNTISWATSYRVEIATDAQFNNVQQQIDLPLGQLTYDWTAPNRGKYYWHVRAKDANNTWRSWSNTESFIVMP